MIDVSKGNRLTQQEQQAQVEWNRLLKESVTVLVIVIGLAIIIVKIVKFATGA
jgi:hypothetical protein